jgi:hypothetical protein
MTTVVEENAYWIPGNRKKTDEHKRFLKYYNEKILHEQDKIVASSNSITHDRFQDLLNQPGCVGMRINFPLDSNISSNSILHSNFILYT